MKNKFLPILLIALALVGCSTIGKTPTPLPTVVLGGGAGSSTTPQAAVTVSPSGGVVASGFIVPERTADLAMASGGIVKTVKAVAGTMVKAGDVLVELDDVAARMDVDQASRNLKEMTSPAAIAAAEQAIAAAQKAVKDTQDKITSLLYPRASDILIENTQGQIDLAKQQLTLATDAYHQVSSLGDGDPKKAAGLVAMTNAQINLNTLLAKYNWFTGKASNMDAATFTADNDAAKAALQEAQWYLSLVKGEQVPAEATGAKLAQLANAKAALEGAQKILENTRLVTPLDGTIISVSVAAGEYAIPGKILVVLSDISRLHVETTDLSERDVPRLKIGQPVIISIKALNLDTTGHLSSISPLAETLGGDVVYQTNILLDTLPPGVRAGMSVAVTFTSK